MQDENAKPARRRWGGTIGLAILIAFSGLLTLAIGIDWLQGVSTHFWPEASCTIEASSLVDLPDGEFDLEVRYRYHFRGELYTGDLYRHGFTGSSNLAEVHRLAARYAPGETVPCWVDPDTPHNAYLERANLWRGLWILVPLVFVAIGVGSLYLVHAPDRDPSTDAAALATGRTPSKGPVKGFVIGLILFGAFFLFGFGMFIPFFVWPTLQVVAARSWVSVPCEIVSSGVRSHTGEDSTTYSVEALYRYRFEGREYVSNRYRFMSGSSSGYESKAAAAAEIPAGSRTECWVDPDDPFEAVIDRGFGADFLFGLIPLLFGLIGAGGLTVMWIAREARKDAARPSWLAPRPVPVERPETGPVTLEPRTGPMAKLLLACVLSVFWNGIVSVFVWQLVISWRAGSFDWFLALFLSPFILIGLLLLSAVPYSLLALVNPRPRLRLSSGVLRAGESVQLDWAFRGAASRIRALKIVLEGTRRERAEGADTRTSPRVFRTLDIVDRGAGMPLDFGSAGIRVPRDVEPSVEGEVEWKLRFHGTIAYWPDVLEEYPVRVLRDEA